MGKGPRRKIEVSICAWVDLLGYGGMLKKSGFDPTIDLAKDAVDRLEIFHQTAAKHATRRFNIFAINDGLISSMDLSPTSNKTTMEYFNSLWALHQEVNQIDIKHGFYGARTVVATGFRVRKAEPVTVQSGIKDFLLDKASSEKLDIKEAIHMAIKARPYFGIIPELQANFAFTKAYLIDSEGKAGGFEGPNFFVDLSIFTQPMPDFVKFEKYVNWSKDGLQAKVGLLKTVDIEKMKSSKGTGFLNGASLGESITSSPEVTSRIQKITKDAMKGKGSRQK